MPTSTALFAALRRLLDRLAAEATARGRPGGPALGRPVDPGAAGLPGPRHAHRARPAAAGRHVPQRRAVRADTRCGRCWPSWTAAAWYAIELGRLGPAETAAQIAGVLNATSRRPRLVERLHARCDGNPFLVEELLAAGPDADPLPAGTRDILLRRVRRLPDADQRLLHAVAVAGRRAEHDLLAAGGRAARRRAAGSAAGGGRRADPGRGSAMGTPSGMRWWPRRSLAEALPGERSRLHRAYAEALARRWARRTDRRRRVAGPGRGGRGDGPPLVSGR